MSLDDLRRRYDAVVLANGRTGRTSSEYKTSMSSPAAACSPPGGRGAYCGDPWSADYSSRVGAFPGPAAEGAGTLWWWGQGTGPGRSRDAADAARCPERDTRPRAVSGFVQSPNGPLSKWRGTWWPGGAPERRVCPRELREILQKRPDQIGAVVTAPGRPTSGEAELAADPFADVPGFKQPPGPRSGSSSS